MNASLPTAAAIEAARQIDREYPPGNSPGLKIATLAIIIDRETQAVELRDALEHSVKLQAHYARLLNQWDGGQRMIFQDADAWLARLREMRLKENKT